MISERVRADDCLSDLVLDRLRVDELGAEQHRAVRGHLEGCASCRAALAELEHDAAVFAEAGTPTWLVAPRRRSWIGPTLAGLTALAAALLVVWWRPAPPVVVPDSDVELGEVATRTKGQARLGAHVRRGDRVFAATRDTTVRAGDALRFSVSTSQPTWIAIVGIDGTGAIAVHHPEGPQAQAMGVGADQLLDLAVELDDAAGPETFVAVFCDRPTSVRAIESALRTDAAPLPPGCVADRLTLEKTR